MRMRARSGGVAAVLVFAGLALLIAAGAGAADVLKHGRRAIGSGTAFGRYAETRCNGPRRVACVRVHGVHVQVDRAQETVKLSSDALYDLVGAGDRRVPVDLEIDTFTNRISRVRAGDRWITTYDSGKGTLFIVVPLVLLGLAVIALNAVPFAVAVGRKLTARRKGWRWTAIVLGVATIAFCVALTSVGLSGDRYDAGSGQLYGRYADFGSTGYHEGAHVSVDGDGTISRTDSSDLFALLETPQSRLPVDVEEDSAGEIARVTYKGTAYAIGPPDWLPLLVVVPLALLAAAAVVLNARGILSKP